MGDVLLFQVDAARDLLSAYRRTASIVGHDAERIRTKLDAAAPHLGRSADGDAAGRVPPVLRGLADLLLAGHDDLAWRLAYLEAVGDGGFPPTLPQRDPALQRLTVPELIAMLDGRKSESGNSESSSPDGRQFEAALFELAVRSALDRSSASTIARQLDHDQLDALGRALEVRMLDVAFRSENIMVLSDDQLAELEHDTSHVSSLINAYGIVLAGLSHDAAGRRTLTEIFSLDDIEEIDGRISRLPLALSAGRWDGDFLIDLGSAMFSEPGLPLATRPYVAAIWNPAGRHRFEAVADPGAALLRALLREPDAAREFVFEHDGIWQVTGSSEGYFGYQIFDPGDVFESDQRDRARAELVRLALTDPTRVDDAYDLLFGEHVGGERGRTGVLTTVTERGPFDDHLTMALAEAWAMQWGNLTDPAAPRGNAAVADDALAVLFANDEARDLVLGGFAPYLEATFADAFRDGSRGSSSWSDITQSSEVQAARDQVYIGFQMLDHAIDSVELDHVDNSRLRGGFRAGVGYGNRQLSSVLSLASFPAAVLSFLVGEFASTAANSIFPDETYDGPSSQEVLEQLFVGQPSHPHARFGQPPSGQIALANAALLADPALAGGLSSTSWFQQGVITPPSADAPVSELDAFAQWFHALVQAPGAPLEPIVDLNQELAHDASVVG